MDAAGSSKTLASTYTYYRVSQPKQLQS